MHTGEKTALWWKVEDGQVRCLLCPHVCLLESGQWGICRTRQNYRGRLVTYAYENLCAINIDSVEKKPLFHFLPGHPTLSIATMGCNLRCLNCQNSHISQSSPYKLPGENISPQQIVNKALDSGCTSISYTYTEPTVYYEYMKEAADIAKKVGLKNIMVSSGYINAEPLKELIPFIDAANIDLKAFDDKTYKELCGIHLKPVLTTIEKLFEAGVWLEITYLVIPGWTDDLKEIEVMCTWMVKSGMKAVPIHFNRFYPSYKLLDVAPTSLTTLQKVFDIAQAAGLKYVYIGNLPGHESENTYCFTCKTPLIERGGNSLLKNMLNEGRCYNCSSPIPGVF